jgi:5-oxoprolinase (ATP-hydrolysing) subunit A
LEGFADRAYERDGSLTPRSRPGSVIHDPEEVVRRAVRMAAGGGVTASDGSEIALHVDTICTHGDTPGAHELTRLLRAGLERQGIDVAPVASSRA